MNNSKVLVFSSCLFAATLTAPPAAHGRGHAGHPGMGMPGHPGMGMPGRPGMGMLGRPGMGMPGRPGMGMLSGGNHVGDLHHHNDHFDHFDHHDRFHHHDHDDDDDVFFINSFGFPFWGWGWGWGYPYYYPPYGYGPYGSYGYGSGYGNGYSHQAQIADLQDRLARAGYYHGPIDGIFGPRTRYALRAYRHDHGNGGYGINNGHQYSYPQTTQPFEPTG